MSKKSRRGRKIPEGENRGPRDRLVGVYFSQSEVDLLETKRLELGYRSKSALITDLLAGPIEAGFTSLSFIKLGKRISERNQ